MKKQLLTLLLLFSLCVTMHAQQITNGDEIEKTDKSKMNRMLDGDNNCFYAVRLRIQGKGNSIFVEKYDKQTLKQQFSKEVPFGERGFFTLFVDADYADGKVYLFLREINMKEVKEVTLNCVTVSSEGVVSAKSEPLIGVETSEQEQRAMAGFVEFKVYSNPSKTKFLFRGYKIPSDNKKYNFVLYDCKSMKKTNITVPESIAKNIFRFRTLLLDDNDRVYFTHTSKSPDNKILIDIISGTTSSIKRVELSLENHSSIGDLKILENSSTNELIVGGFVYDKMGSDNDNKLRPGFFNFTVNLTDYSIKNKSENIFDDKFLLSMKSVSENDEGVRFNFDNIILNGNEIFYIGQKFKATDIERIETRQVQSSSGRTMGPGITSSQHSDKFEYMDIIIGKINSKGEFEWVKNSPFRMNQRLWTYQELKNYIVVATDNSICILNDENAENLELVNRQEYHPEEFKSVSSIHGSNFVKTIFDTRTGAMNHSLVFKNETYCFAPIQEKIAGLPSSDDEIFVKGKRNDIYIYMEDKGKYRFSRIELQ